MSVMKAAVAELLMTPGFILELGRGREEGVTLVLPDGLGPRFRAADNRDKDNEICIIGNFLAHFCIQDTSDCTNA